MILFLPVFIAAISLLIGAFIFLKPQSAIEMQRRFYAGINWRIEPISLSKEIRNTRIMGVFLMLIALFTIGYLVKK